MQPQYEVATVLTAHWSAVQQSAKFNTWQLRTLHAVRRCRSAALRAHWMVVPVAATCASAIIAAVTAIVQNARATREKDGYRQDSRNSYPFLIFMWCSHFRTTQPHCASTSPQACLTFCLKAPGMYSIHSGTTLNGWEHKPA